MKNGADMFPFPGRSSLCRGLSGLHVCLRECARLGFTAQRWVFGGSEFGVRVQGLAFWLQGKLYG